MPDNHFFMWAPQKRAAVVAVVAIVADYEIFTFFEGDARHIAAGGDNGVRPIGRIVYISTPPEMVTESARQGYQAFNKCSVIIQGKGCAHTPVDLILPG